MYVYGRLAGPRAAQTAYGNGQGQPADVRLVEGDGLDKLVKRLEAVQRAPHGRRGQDGLADVADQKRVALVDAAAQRGVGAGDVDVEGREAHGGGVPRRERVGVRVRVLGGMAASLLLPQLFSVREDEC